MGLRETHYVGLESAVGKSKNFAGPGSELLPRVLPSPARRPPQTIVANRSLLAFAPLRPAATTATFTVCDDRGPRAAVAIIVSRSGRPRVTRHDANGDPLACP